jgi:glycine/D-amino acid oxidase-like deaminating enzyme
MDRRTALKAMGVVAVAGLGPSCASRSSTPPSAPPSPGRRLARVDVSPDRIIRTVVGLRPFRPSGFRVQLEKLDSKAVIHNYGHGGAGITFSWGTAQQAVELALETGERRFAVIGCGVVGLSTARLLQDHGFEVAIYAKDLPPNTTSNVAGALWGPHAIADSDRRTARFDEAFVRAANFSNRYFQDLIGEDYGVRWLESYMASDQPIRPTWESELVPNLWRDTVDLERSENAFPFGHAQRFQTMLIEPARYLRSLMRDFLLRRGSIVVREFHSREEILALDEPVAMNCSGLGAGELFSDREMTPIKGQLAVLLPQPEVDYVLIAGDLYMFPRSDGIILGGTHERGVYGLEPNQQAARRILKGHQRIFRTMRAERGNFLARRLYAD